MCPFLPHQVAGLRVRRAILVIVGFVASHTRSSPSASSADAGGRREHGRPEGGNLICLPLPQWGRGDEIFPFHFIARPERGTRTSHQMGGSQGEVVEKQVFRLMDILFAIRKGVESAKTATFKHP